MLFYFIASIVAGMKRRVRPEFVAIAFCGVISADTPTIVETYGTALHGLQPHVFAMRSGGDWAVEIGFIPRAVSIESLRHRWFKVPGGIGIPVELSTEVADEVRMTSDAQKEPAPPKEVDVKEVFEMARPRSSRGMLWLRFHSHERAPCVDFNLSTLFKTDLRGAYILRLKPRLYRVTEDGRRAELVEFPSMELRLPPISPDTGRAIPRSVPVASVNHQSEVYHEPKVESNTSTSCLFGQWLVLAAAFVACLGFAWLLIYYRQRK